MKFDNTIAFTTSTKNYFKPKSIQELKDNFLEQKAQSSEIHVFSKGNNWGYGCKTPHSNNALVINLSECREIVHFDKYHGLVTVEPGVTYGQLVEYLKNAGDEWIAPVHGGGPDCSVLGNCIERGYGITPETDHFGAVTSLQAILPDGSIYHGALKNLGLDKLDKLFKYGIGPYYDGLFTQSGLGIVTQVTIKLSKKPSYVEMFYINIFDENDLPKVVSIIKKLKQNLKSNIGGINLMNRERVLSMLMDYPLDKIKSGESLSEDELFGKARDFQVTPWIVVGMLYGEKGIVKECKKTINKEFKDIKKRRFFYNTTNRRIFNFISAVLDKCGEKNISSLLHRMEEAYQLLNGIPGNVALRLAYWKNENKDLVNQSQLNPTRDGCGLIWYAPLVEMNPESVLEYVKFLNEASLKFKINSLITLTTIDDLCFDSTVPILFNTNNLEDVKKARDYHEYLLFEGKKRGFFPYRLSVEYQSKFDIQQGYLKLESINTHRYKKVG